MLSRSFQPAAIGRLELGNRFIFLPMGHRFWAEEGRVSEEAKAFLIERAKGGSGLVMTSACPVYVGKDPLALGLYDDLPIADLHGLVREIHRHGAKAGVQLLMSGHWVRGDQAGVEFIGPSAIAKRQGLPTPRPLTEEEITYLVGAFAQAARRARNAGFDVVEIHAGMGYLVNQFLSPVTNKRLDEYGSSFERRMRFLLEIIASIKGLVGNDYPLICRISADEFMEGGYTLTETQRIARVLEHAGVHALSVQAGWHESPVPLVQSSVVPGQFAYLAEGIKKAVNIPVVAAYRINNPLVAEQILAEGKADLIGMCRALIADPTLPNKARQGCLEEIRPCIACCRCLDAVFRPGVQVTCSVNPWVGRESESVVARGDGSKKVYVVGGGPAGLVAARVAADQGHRVTLFDGTERLGGALVAGCVPLHKEDIAALIQHLVHQARAAGVHLLVGRQLTRETAEIDCPDAVIVAAGASHLVPPIPGIQNTHVITAVDVLLGRRKVTGKVVVVGGGMIGCETAEWLWQRGHDVVILEMLDRIAGDMGPTARWAMLQRLRKAGIKTEIEVTVGKVLANGVEIRRSEATEFVEADTVVLAAGLVANSEVVCQFENGPWKTIEVGDCVRPRRIRDAIDEGFRAGLEAYGKG